MGGEYFDAYGEGTDPELVFKTLVEKAYYDHGHAGYTGPICEKPGFDLVSDVPIPLSEAGDWASDYDSEVSNDKWGNAYAIPVCTDEKHQEVIGYLFFGVASS